MAPALPLQGSTSNSGAAMARPGTASRAKSITAMGANGSQTNFGSMSGIGSSGGALPRSNLARGSTNVMDYEPIAPTPGESPSLGMQGRARKPVRRDQSKAAGLGEWVGDRRH